VDTAFQPQRLCRSDRTGCPLHDSDHCDNTGGSCRPSMVPCRTMPLASGRTRRATRNSLPTQPWRMYLPKRSRVPGAPLAADSILIFSSACLTPTPVNGARGHRPTRSRTGRPVRVQPIQARCRRRGPGRPPADGCRGERRWVGDPRTRGYHSLCMNNVAAFHQMNQHPSAPRSVAGHSFGSERCW